MGASSRWFAAAALLLLTAGCAAGGDEPAGQVATPKPIPAPATSTPPPTAGSAAPETTGSAPPEAQPNAEAQPSAEAQPKAEADGACGAVTAASGLRLQVLPDSTVPCAEATDLVRRFQEQLAGKQPAGSNQPASATVDGWLCVSGPPAAQGGTTCSKLDKTVFAGVASE
ncbi:hypothetical protein [Amycolatopsis dongchuanensis]|uniref:Uncharacterized protein n=1 Tax=Amycolatopsis dongchuanensis TaxID=1070866 RepID=A0ABP9Q5Y0_9PSEU